MFLKYCSILSGACAFELGDAKIHSMVASMNFDEANNILERGNGVRGAFIKSCDGNHESLQLQQITYNKKTE